MLKSIFTIALAFTAFMVTAQSVEDARKAFENKKNDKAKEAIDKLTADPNLKNAEAWYLKTQIYNALAVDEKFKATVPEAYEQAFDAFKKAVDIDPNNKMLLLDVYKAGFVAYEGVANKAAAAYQANKMEEAFQTYKKALEYGAYLNTKNLSFGGFNVPKLDTGMVFMAGYTAMKIDRKDDAIIYFSRLANARINSEVDYIIPYQFLAFQYKAKKDEENFKKYAGLGKQMYPKDPYFVTIMLDWARENNNFPELFKTYEELIAMQPDTLNNYLSYASEMFGYLYKNTDTKPADFDATAVKIESMLKKIIDKNYEVQNASLILAQLYYNQGLDFVTEADKIRSTKPEDVKKKNEIKAKAVVKYEGAIPYAEKVASEIEAKGAGIRPADKGTLKNMYIILEEMYNLKGNKAKADEYNKKYLALNANK